MLIEKYAILPSISTIAEIQSATGCIIMQPSDSHAFNGGLTPAQQKAALLLGRGESVKSGAETIDVDRSTLWRWRQNPQFKERINSVHIDAYDAAVSSLCELSGTAVSTLRELIEQSKNENIRLRAAISILKALGLMNAKIDRRTAEEIVTERQDREFQRSLNRFGFGPFGW